MDSETKMLELGSSSTSYSLTLSKAQFFHLVDGDNNRTHF